MINNIELYIHLIATTHHYSALDAGLADCPQSNINSDHSANIALTTHIINELPPNDGSTLAPHALTPATDCIDPPTSDALALAASGIALTIGVGCQVMSLSLSFHFGVSCALI
jgi:hypothetical protein